jgi:hypothetical protein
MWVMRVHPASESVDLQGAPSTLAAIKEDNGPRISPRRVCVHAARAAF